MNNYLPILKIQIEFFSSQTIEVDRQDLLHVFEFFGFYPKYVTIIKKNNYFMTFAHIEEVFVAFKHLNDYEFDENNAVMKLWLCKKSDMSSFVDKGELWTANFEIRVPNIPHFNVKERFLGNSICNVKRIMYLCEKEYFEDLIKIEYSGKKQ